MGTSEFQQEFGGTTVCIKRLMTKKGVGNFCQNDTYFDDIWFSGVKTAEEENEEELYYCGPVNIRHKGFY